MTEVITCSHAKPAVEAPPVPLSRQGSPAKKVKVKPKVCTSLLQVLLLPLTFFLKPHLVYQDIANDEDVLHEYVAISDQCQQEIFLGPNAEIGEHGGQSSSAGDEEVEVQAMVNGVSGY